MPESFEVEAEVPAEPARVYEAWMDTKQHAAFTGAPALVEDWVGGRFTAHDGYIHGINLQLDPGKRIVQSWRSSEFPQGAQDSRITVDFLPVPGGTLIKLKHVDVPMGQTKVYKPGWVNFYFKSLARYFAPKPPKEKARRAAAVPAPAPTAAPVTARPAKPPRAAAPARAAARTATPARAATRAATAPRAAARTATPARAAARTATPARAAARTAAKPAAKTRAPAAARRAKPAAKRSGSTSKSKASPVKRSSARRAPAAAKRAKSAGAKRGKPAKAKKKSARR